MVACKALFKAGKPQVARSTFASFIGSLLDTGNIQRFIPTALPIELAMLGCLEVISARLAPTSYGLPATLWGFEFMAQPMNALKACA